MKTYGTIERHRSTRGENQWKIDCEPHVRIRLKKLLRRIGMQYGVIYIKDTEEVCRDLLWFMDRYPMEMKALHRMRLKQRAAAYDERIDSYERVLSGDIEPRRFELRLPPREYQAMATELWLRCGGLLVADDLGLGKTLVGIAGIVDPKLRPALVVVPTHLVRQWKGEIQKFAPGMRVHVIKKGTVYDFTAERGAKKEQQGQFSFAGKRPFPDVLITTYSKLAGWADTLAPKIRSIIFDVVQDRRRGSVSNKGAAAVHLARNVDHRLGLSATPIYNYGGEMFNVMDILRPEALGARQEFIREWCGYSTGDENKARIDDPKAFGTYLRESGFMIRRKRRDVGMELPPVTKVPHHIDADTKALSTLDNSVAELARIILRQGGSPLEKGRAARDLDWRLRQATGIAKAPFVSEFVKLLLESGERVLLFGWHREVYSIWMDRLKGYGPRLYSGSESPSQKERAKEDFIRGRTKILIMSLRSGSGVDGLQQVCRTAVFGELDWSPGVHEQCVGRLHRDGQGEPVMAYYLVSDSGSDPVVADVLQIKKGQIEGVRDPDGPLVQQLQVDPNHIKRLATHYLSERGIALPKEESVEEQRPEAEVEPPSVLPREDLRQQRFEPWG